MTAGAFGTEWSVKYNQQEICALKGSTVFMNATFTHPEGLTVTETFWTIDPVPGVELTDLSKDPVYSGRVEFFTDDQKHFSLKLSDVMKKDEHQFCFRIKTNVEEERWTGCPGVQLRVTALHVEAPEEVTEGQTVDLTCKTTCSLTDPTFIWYKNGCPLTTKTIKNNQLHLQTVSSEDAGSYSCAVGGSQHLNSTAHRLRVGFWIAVGGGSFVCLLLTVFICICRMKERAPGTDNSETNQDGVLYTSVTHRTSRPAQAADSADSGAADVLHDTVRVQNDEVTSTDQQEEPQYASVTFLPHPAVTG
ncbi:CD276 antigen homolog [Pygocentrus nattereri]|uniref:CD276 antigen homolog n=1 Tax=Pygocentrus nattereri TaxID=42514 RepID=UPI001891EC9E|nr:CD276 antigen homolog [Pygocentrus nattereri]